MQNKSVLSLESSIKSSFVSSEMNEPLFRL